MASGGRRRKQSRRPKAKKRTRYLSLSRLIIKAEVATPPTPSSSPSEDAQAEPFALMHHEASTLFDALPAPSLSDILGAADDSPSPSASPDAGVSGGAAGFTGAEEEEEEEDLARRALRGRERWVYCCGSTTSSPTTTTTTTTTTASTSSSSASTGASARPALLLKLDYEEILAAWADRGSLYIAHAAAAPAKQESDPELLDHVLVEVEPPPRQHAPAARREESVRRYKEKRRNRLFAHRVRYEVRRVNAVRRPRFKGRFIKEHEEMETQPT